MSDYTTSLESDYYFNQTNDTYAQYNTFSFNTISVINTTNNKICITAKTMETLINTTLKGDSKRGDINIQSNFDSACWNQSGRQPDDIVRINLRYDRDVNVLFQIRGAVIKKHPVYINELDAWVHTPDQSKVIDTMNAAVKRNYLNEFIDKIATASTCQLYPVFKLSEDTYAYPKNRKFVLDASGVPVQFETLREGDEDTLIIYYPRSTEYGNMITEEYIATEEEVTKLLNGSPVIFNIDGHIPIGISQVEMQIQLQNDTMEARRRTYNIDLEQLKLNHAKEIKNIEKKAKEDIKNASAEKDREIARLNDALNRYEAKAKNDNEEAKRNYSHEEAEYNKEQAKNKAKTEWFKYIVSTVTGVLSLIVSLTLLFKKK
jgi:hypothetical protein